MLGIAHLYRAARSKLRPLRGRLRDVRGVLLRDWAVRQWRRQRTGVTHSLPAPLIVSLTSYPARFATLTLTLQCLLSQSVRPDRVVLWIAWSDLNTLPANVTALRAHGLDIRPTSDLRSFKKFVPALRLWPHAFIATADDDVFYPTTWLAELVAGYAPGRSEIPCHRAHLIRLSAAGVPLPYVQWRHDVRHGPVSALTFPTGVGGALYPPGSLHVDATQEDIFSKLCPANDDAWIYWMGRLAGWRFRKIGARRSFIPWPGTQRIALQHENASGGNDAQIANLIAHYGFPAQPPPALSPQFAPPSEALGAW